MQYLQAVFFTEAVFFTATDPAATTAYMIAGFVVIFSAMLFYLVSLVVRQHNLMRELEMLRKARDPDDKSSVF